METYGTVYTLDEALSTIGFGKYQCFLLAYGALGWVAESMEVMILSFIGSAVQSDWGLSPGEKSLISTVVFFGMLIGACFWGFISDTYGRKKGLLGVATITAGAGLLSAFSPNYISLVIVRCVAGVGLGGMTIFSTWFLEFVPTSNRGSWMVVSSSFWAVGTILEAALALIVMPRLGWRWLLSLSSLPAFIVLLLYFLAPESPRFLCLKGRMKEAQNILEKVARINGTRLQTGILVLNCDNQIATSETTPLLSSERDESCNAEAGVSSLFQLFSPKLMRTNLVLWILCFAYTFAYYGVILLTSELSSSSCGTTMLHSTIQNSSLYTNVFISSLAELPGIVTALLIVERVGRKLSMVIMALLAAILLSPLLTDQNEIFTLTSLFGARCFIVSSFTIRAVYAPEVYPTNLRSTGVGIASAMGRIGGMICPIVAVGLVNSCHRTSAVILFECVILVSALCALLAPFETKGRNLVDNVAP